MLLALRDTLEPALVMERGVSLRDLEFEWTLAQCETPLGRINKWVPYGVPKIGDRFNKAVFFLHRTNPKTGKVDEGPLGTGFFTYRFTDDADGKRAGTHYYGITNYHVAIGLGATIIRINTKDGGTHDIPFETEDWHFVPNGDDICAVDIDVSNFGTGAWDCIPEFAFLGRNDIEKRQIGLGENAFMIGLFVSHHGGKKNVPSGRFGNLSMLADDDFPIRTEGFNRPAHVVDMHSRTGFSGSPVFVWRTPFDDLQGNAASGGVMAARVSGISQNMFWGFIGIHCSQFQERVRVRKAPRAKSEGMEDEAGEQKVVEISGQIRDGDYIVMPSSMTLVVPSWRISELLDLEVFEMIRQQRDAESHAKGDDAEPLPASEGVDAPPATAANPNHREDFTRLLGEAVRKPEPKGRT